MAYRVTAPLVNVKTETEFGLRWVYIYQGGRIPDDADPQWTENHLRDGLIAEIPDNAPPAAAPLPPEPPPPPAEPAPAPAAGPVRGAAAKAQPKPG